jgi:pyruvate dehydrogenase E1 component beta subunit
MAQAVAEAIGQEMERDPKVFVMGEDIGKYGGIFSATAGLLDRFGPDRIMDTPISETAFIGAATGAAAEGFRPIAELMFVDFSASVWTRSTTTSRRIPTCPAAACICRSS